MCTNEIKYVCTNVDLNKGFNLIDINTEEFINKTKDKLNKKWKLDLCQKPKLRRFVTFKDAFKTEEYIIHCNSRRKR